MARPPVQHVPTSSTPPAYTGPPVAPANPMTVPIVAPTPLPLQPEAPINFPSTVPGFDPKDWFNGFQPVNLFRWSDAYAAVTLCREAQYPMVQTIVDMIAKAFTQVSYARVAASGTTAIGFSTWKIGNQQVIYAFPGTQDLSQWVGYGTGTLQANTNFPTSDMAQYYSAFDRYMKDT